MIDADVREMYVRACRDSGFRFSAIEAAHFTAKVLKISALEVWLALGLDNMERVAAGTHPAARKGEIMVTMTDIHEAIARNLRDFGYPDVTAKMIAEIHDAYRAGKREGDLPHGIIGRFAQAQIEDNAEMIARVGS